jgi:hypothetical protein
MPEWSGYRGSWLAFGGRQHFSLSLRQTWHALKLQHQRQRHHYIIDVAAAIRRALFSF